MDHRTTTSRWRGTLFAVGISLLVDASPGRAVEDAKAEPKERREALSLADSAIRALKNNLDISISRHNK